MVTHHKRKQMKVIIELSTGDAMTLAAMTYVLMEQGVKTMAERPLTYNRMAGVANSVQAQVYGQIPKEERDRVEKLREQDRLSGL